jgi:hypothetical protein
MLDQSRVALELNPDVLVGAGAAPAIGRRRLDPIVHRHHPDPDSDTGTVAGPDAARRTMRRPR